MIKQGNTEIGIISFPDQEIKAKAEADKMSLDLKTSLHAEYLDDNSLINNVDFQRFE